MSSEFRRSWPIGRIWPILTMSEKLANWPNLANFPDLADSGAVANLRRIWPKLGASSTLFRQVWTILARFRRVFGDSANSGRPRIGQVSGCSPDTTAETRRVNPRRSRIHFLDGLTRARRAPPQSGPLALCPGRHGAGSSCIATQPAHPERDPRPATPVLSRAAHHRRQRAAKCSRSPCSRKGHRGEPRTREMLRGAQCRRNRCGVCVCVFANGPYVETSR